MWRGVLCSVSLILISLILDSKAQLVVQKTLTLTPVVNQTNNYSFIISWIISWKNDTPTTYLQAFNFTFQDDVRNWTVRNFTFPNSTVIQNVPFLRPNSTYATDLVFYDPNPFLRAIGVTRTISYSGFLSSTDFDTTSNNWRNVTATYFILNSPTNSATGPFSASGSVCVQRNNTVTSINNTPQYGVVIVTILVGLLVGFFLALLLALLCLFCCPCGRNSKSRRSATVVPVHEDDRAVLEKVEDRLIMRHGSNDVTRIQHVSHLQAHETIVIPLYAPTRIQRYRDIDLMDILESAEADAQLETEHETLSMEAMHALVYSLMAQGVVKDVRTTESAHKLAKAYQELHNKCEKKFKKKMAKHRKVCSQRNNVQLATLLNAQRKLRNDVLGDYPGEEENEQVKTLLSIYDKQFEVERNDLVQELKMVQDEETEQLRKEFVLFKRAAVKELQVAYLRDLIDEFQLSSSQSDWLLMEHKRIQTRLSTLYDEEIAKERALFDEKLERRKTLAKIKELEEENERETLNTLADQQTKLLKRLRSERDITPEQCDIYLSDLKRDFANIREQFEKQKKEQITALHEKLCDQKRRNMSNKQEDMRTTTNQIRQQMLEKIVVPSSSAAGSSSSSDEKDKKKDTKGKLKAEKETDGKESDRKEPFSRDTNKHRHRTSDEEDEEENRRAIASKVVDPVDYLETWFNAYSRQFRMLCDYENSMDEEHVKELLNSYNTLLLHAEDDIIEIKKKLLDALKNDGSITEDSIGRLLIQHSKEVQKLRQEIDEERKIQKDNLSKRLSERRTRLTETIRLEEEEQMALRKRESEFVAGLLRFQACFSQDDRHRMEQEVAKADAQLENCLALTKLQRNRMVENVYRERKQENLKKHHKKLKIEKEKENNARKRQRNGPSSNRGSRRRGRSESDSSMSSSSSNRNRRGARRRRDSSSSGIHSDDSEGRRQSQSKNLANRIREREQLLSVVQGEDIDMEDDQLMEEIEVRLVDARAQHVRAQELRVATCVVHLQIRKSVAEVESDAQGLAFHLLKYCLLEEMSDRRLLDQEQCARLTRQHGEDLADLREKFWLEKKKHMKSVRLQLEDRMKMKLDQHEVSKWKQLNEKTEKIPSNERAMKELTKVLFLQGQLLVSEEFKLNVQHELLLAQRESARLLEFHHKQETHRLSHAFLGGLARLGKFTRGEILAVLHVFFPDKSQQDLADLENTIRTEKHHHHHHKQDETAARTDKSSDKADKADKETAESMIVPSESNLLKKARIAQIIFSGLFPVESYYPATPKPPQFHGDEPLSSRSNKRPEELPLNHRQYPSGTGHSGDNSWRRTGEQLNNTFTRDSWDRHRDHGRPHGSRRDEFEEPSYQPHSYHKKSEYVVRDSPSDDYYRESHPSHNRSSERYDDRPPPYRSSDSMRMREIPTVTFSRASPVPSSRGRSMDEPPPWSRSHHQASPRASTPSWVEEPRTSVRQYHEDPYMSRPSLHQTLPSIRGRSLESDRPTQSRLPPRAPSSGATSRHFSGNVRTLDDIMDDGEDRYSM